MSNPVPLSAGPSDPLQLTCPICGGALHLLPAHLGIEGFCPVCQTPIVARRAADGSVTVHGLFPTILGPLDPEPVAAQESAVAPVSAAAQESSHDPLADSLPAPAAQESELPHRSVARPRQGTGFPLWITGLGLLLIAAAVALHVSRPPQTVATPAPSPAPEPALAPEPKPTPPPSSAPAPAPIAPAAATAPGPAPETGPAGFADTAVATLRDFLAATRPWEKLLHVMEPEEDLLSILAFQELAPVSADTDVRHVATRRSDPANGNRWVSHLEWTESDGTARRLVVVHRDGDRAEAAKFDFSLYWQNRSDVLTAFRDRKAPGEPLEVRVLVRRGPSAGDDTSVWELAQPDTSFPPLPVRLDPASPVSAELTGRVGDGESVPAVIELAWRSGEPETAEVTISRVVRWGWWPAWEGG